MKNKELDIETIISTVEKYFGMKRLPDYVIQVNEAAKIKNAERKKMEELGMTQKHRGRKKKLDTSVGLEIETNTIEKVKEKYETPVVTVKRPRGRPRKIKVEA